MKVTDIHIRKTASPITVTDCFVNKGLVSGGHASLPDIDVDYASDRRQEIKEYLDDVIRAGAANLFLSQLFRQTLSTLTGDRKSVV